MLRLKEVASQSETFSKPVAKPRLNQRIETVGPTGHYRVVFSIDRPPLLAVGHPSMDSVPLNDNLRSGNLNFVRRQEHCSPFIVGQVRLRLEKCER